MTGMDDFDALIADLAETDLCAARARLHLAAGGTQKEADAITRGSADPRNDRCSAPNVIGGSR